MATLIVNNEIDSEFLTPDEVKKLTGASHLRSQICWLKKECWEYSLNKQNQILIGRWYFRFKIAGIAIITNIPSMEIPNFEKIK
mgnify:FL=1